MDSERAALLAADLWQQLGYEGCRDLREALRLRMAEHRASIAAEREAAGLARPRSRRKPTVSQQVAQALDTSESTLARMAAVERWAPHLVPLVTAGSLSTWGAYQQVTHARDMAALRAAGLTDS